VTRPLAGRDRHSRPAVRATALTIFLGILLVTMVVYTTMAMEMQWRTAAGRIGPGFFPRIIGFGAIALCIVAAIQSLRPRKSDEADAASQARHPRALLVLTGAGVIFLLMLVPLGAIVASAVFLLATLWYLDRGGHIKRYLAVAVLLPVVLYLLFQVALNAGLPSGILPIL
jgi:putative tricarboxylic transport membrane protein